MRKTHAVGLIDEAPAFTGLTYPHPETLAAKGIIKTFSVFARMPEEPGVRMELVRGRVVRMSPAGYEHGDSGTRILLLLAPHVIREGLGKVLMPTGFRLQTNPDTVREPDVAFISRQRLPSSVAGSRGFLQSAPGGVRMVWTVDPRRETVTVHRPSGKPVTLREGDVLDRGDVIPGFRCDITRLFRDDI